MSQASSGIVSFYRGTGRDHRGRSLEEILGWDDDALEGVHDYIQWLFPLDERSAFNPDAPLVSGPERTTFQSDPQPKANLRRAFIRMLAFYGFEMIGERVERSSDWPERSRAWLRPHNHNYLRLTRMMKSLRLLGQRELAQALQRALLAEYDLAPDRIGTTTMRFWRGAAE